MRWMPAITAVAWLYWGAQMLWALRRIALRHWPAQLALRLALWAVAGAVWALNTLGFICDEVLFAAYRRTPVREPVFIIGIPRSGTTFLQRVLAQDRAATGLTLAEALFYPSITQRHCARALAKVLGPLTSRFGAIALPGMPEASVHALGLSEPEEDFLLLAPLGGCFLMALTCPGAKHFWNLANFDRALPAWYRRALMRYYHRCVQKHLTFHGAHRRFISKNPSFTPCVESLRAQFPDACFVACTRPAIAAVPSQLSALLPAARALQVSLTSGPVRDGMLQLLKNYYRVIDRHERAGGRWHTLTMTDVQMHTQAVVAGLYTALHWPITPEFQVRLDALASASRQYQSGHRYSPGDFDLTPAAIDDFFAEPVIPLHRSNGQNTAKRETTA